jgi:hypothetical protein
MKNPILNLTQHAATPDQVEAGIVDLPSTEKAELVKLLTFDTIPSHKEIFDRADQIADLALKVLEQYFSNKYIGLGADLSAPNDYAMIGGAPYLMGPLEKSLETHHINPLYAFSVRDSVDQIQPDGSTKKVAVFRHGGFI